MTATSNFKKHVIHSLLKVNNEAELGPLERHLPMTLRQVSNDLEKLLQQTREKENVKESESLKLFETAMSHLIVKKYIEEEGINEEFKRFLDDRYGITIGKIPANLRKKIKTEVLPLLVENVEDMDSEDVEHVNLDHLVEKAHEELQKAGNDLPSFREKFEELQKELF